MTPPSTHASSLRAEHRRAATRRGRAAKGPRRPPGPGHGGRGEGRLRRRREQGIEPVSSPSAHDPHPPVQRLQPVAGDRDRGILRRQPGFDEPAECTGSPAPVRSRSASRPGRSTWRSASATTAWPSAEVLLRPSADAGKTTSTGSSPLITLPSLPTRATTLNGVPPPPAGALRLEARRLRPSGVQPQDGFLDVFVPSRGERCLGPDCPEAAFFQDAQGDRRCRWRRGRTTAGRSPRPAAAPGPASRRPGPRLAARSSR